MLEINNNVTEIKNDFDGLASVLETAKERISELEYRSTEIFQTEITEQKRMKTNKGTSKNGVILTRVTHMCFKYQEKNKRKHQRRDLK